MEKETVLNDDLKYIHAKVLELKKDDKSAQKPKHPDLRIPAVIVLFLLNNIAGFWAYYFSVRAKEEWEKRNYRKSKDLYKSSLTCLLIGIVVGIATYIVLIALYTNHKHLFCLAQPEAENECQIIIRRTGRRRRSGNCIVSTYMTTENSVTTQATVWSDGTTVYRCNYFTDLSSTQSTTSETSTKTTEEASTTDESTTDNLCTTEELSTLGMSTTDVYSTTSETSTNSPTMTSLCPSTLELLSSPGSTNSGIEISLSSTQSFLQTDTTTNTETQPTLQTDITTKSDSSTATST